MLNRYFATGALIAITSTGALLAAQSPAEQTPGQTPSAPAASRPAPATAQTAEKTAPTTLTGCVYREKDIPGRSPNVAERVGIGEDYIFAEIPSSPIAGRTAPGASSTPVGTSGSALAMYKLHKIDSDKVKPLVGRRVEVVGQIETEPGDQVAPAPGQQSSKLDKVVGRDAVNLSEIAVASIREVAGACPATPGSAQ